MMDRPRPMAHEMDAAVLRLAGVAGRLDAVLGKAPQYRAVALPSLSNPDALWCDRCGAGIDDPTGPCPACAANPATGEDYAAEPATTGRLICSWCKLDLGPSSTDGDSHGICAACAETYFPKH
jgi:hypothetical protein